MVSAECDRSGDAVDGMDAAQTTPAVCRSWQRGRRERHGYARHRARRDRHHAPANRDSTMAATARCSDTADCARARAGTRASAGHSRARRRAAGCGAASMEPADLVAAEETALCDGSGLRCSRAARRAIAVDLLGRALERRDAPGSVAGRCRRSVRVRLVAREAHSHHARAAARTLATAGCVPWNVQRGDDRSRGERCCATRSISDSGYPRMDCRCCRRPWRPRRDDEAQLARAVAYFLSAAAARASKQVGRTCGRS